MKIYSQHRPVSALQVFPAIICRLSAIILVPRKNLLSWSWLSSTSSFSVSCINNHNGLSTNSGSRPRPYTSLCPRDLKGPISTTFSITCRLTNADHNSPIIRTKTSIKETNHIDIDSTKNSTTCTAISSSPDSSKNETDYGYSSFIPSLETTLTKTSTPQTSRNTKMNRNTKDTSSPSIDSTIEVGEGPGPGRTYAKQPFTWAQLVDIVQHKQDLSLLSRSVEQQRNYALQTDEIKRNWKSVYDFILFTKFQFEKRLMDHDEYALKEETRSDAECSSMQLPQRKWEAYPPSSRIDTIEKRLVLNDFPYFLEDGIEHWVLWKLGMCVTEEDVQEAIRDLSAMDFDDDEREVELSLLDTLHFINPTHLKSVPDIDHAHILCLRKKSRIT